jgi:hypothetical protein
MTPPRPVKEAIIDPREDCKLTPDYRKCPMPHAEEGFPLVGFGPRSAVLSDPGDVAILTLCDPARGTTGAASGTLGPSPLPARADGPELDAAD